MWRSDAHRGIGPGRAPHTGLARRCMMAPARVQGRERGPRARRCHGHGHAAPALPAYRAVISLSWPRVLAWRSAGTAYELPAGLHALARAVGVRCPERREGTPRTARTAVRTAGRGPSAAPARSVCDSCMSIGCACPLLQTVGNSYTRKYRIAIGISSVIAPRAGAWRSRKRNLHMGPVLWFVLVAVMPPRLPALLAPAPLRPALHRDPLDAPLAPPRAHAFG